MSVDELYRRLDEGGNHYGPRFRCVRSLRTDGRQAWGRMLRSIRSPSRQADRYRFHPALLDAAMHIVLELLRVEDRLELYLPVGVDRITVSRAVGSEAYCLVRNAYRIDSVLGADIFIYDQSQTPSPCWKVADAVRIEASSAKNSAVQTLIWQWEPKPAEASRPGPSSWRLFGFSAADMQELSDQVGDDCLAL